jgi:hypothetical protein
MGAQYSQSYQMKQQVIIITNDSDFAEIASKTGEICGITEPYEDGTCDYGVFIYDLQEVWQVHESKIKRV